MSVEKSWPRPGSIVQLPELAIAALASSAETRKRARRGKAAPVSKVLDKTHVAIMEKETSSTNLTPEDEPSPESDALQLLDICSLSQTSDHYNSSIALLLDWSKTPSSNAVCNQTSVTSKDYKQICQVESEDNLVRFNEISLGSNANSTVVAAKSQQSVLEEGISSTLKDNLPNSEKELPGILSEDVFCCILGWSARMTGKSLCSCKKDQFTVPTSDSLPHLGEDSTPSNNSNSTKQPEVSSLVPEKGPELPPSALEGHECQTNIADLSMEDLLKCDASTSTSQTKPLVMNSPEHILLQQPEGKDCLPFKEALNMKTRSKSKDIVPSEAPSSVCDLKLRSTQSPLQKEPPIINGAKSSVDSVRSSEEEMINMPEKDPINIKKENDLEEYAISPPCGTRLESNCSVASTLQSNSPTVNGPSPSAGLAHTSEAENNPLLIDPSNIKKESEEYAIGNGPSPPCGTEVESKCSAGVSHFQTCAPILKASTPEGENKPPSCIVSSNIKKECDQEDDLAPSKDPPIFCCILSWLAQGSNKVQCSCAGEVKTEPSGPTPVSDLILKTEDGLSDTKPSRKNGSLTKHGHEKRSEDTASSKKAGQQSGPSLKTTDSFSVPDTRQTHARKNGSITKPGRNSENSSSVPDTKRRHSRKNVKDGSEDSQSSTLPGQQSEPPQLTWPDLFVPQPESSSSYFRGPSTKRKNASISEGGPGNVWAAELARQQLQQRSLTWLGMLGLQSKMNANSKGRQKRKALMSEEEVMGLAQSHMQGHWPLNIPSEFDSPLVPSKKLKSDILNMIKAKTADANQKVTKNKGGPAAVTTKTAAKGKRNMGGSGNATKQKGGKQQSGLGAGTTLSGKKQTGKVDGSVQKSGKGKSKLAVGVTKGAGKQAGSKQKGGKQKGKLSGGTAQRAGKQTAVLGGKSGLKAATRTGSSKAKKNPATPQKNGQDATSSQGLTNSGQKRKKPGPKKGTKKIILLEPNSEVVQQTVDLTLNYLNQIFFLEKLF